MALTKCSDCLGVLSHRATMCPHCGAPNDAKEIKIGGMTRGQILAACGIAATILGLIKGVQDQWEWVTKNAETIANISYLAIADTAVSYIGKGCFYWAGVGIVAALAHISWFCLFWVVTLGRLKFEDFETPWPVVYALYLMCFILALLVIFEPLPHNFFAEAVMNTKKPIETPNLYRVAGVISLIGIVIQVVEYFQTGKITPIGSDRRPRRSSS